MTQKTKATPKTSHGMRPRERALRLELADMTGRAQRAERDEAAMRAEYGRYDRALDELMRDVLRFVGDPLSHPTSINGGQLIAAVEKASRTVHTRTP